jgi:hypothetical protein
MIQEIQSKIVDRTTINKQNESKSIDESTSDKDIESESVDESTNDKEIESNVVDESIKAIELCRGYQQKLVDLALESNSIAFLPTGFILITFYHQTISLIL